jgi:probable F420-dependent oxidoreductase
MATVVEAAREALGPVGVCLPGSLTVPLNADLQRDAVRRFDRVGYRTVWVNEVIGKDAFVQLGVLLAETERMVFGTCIANIWARPAQTMHAAGAQLAEAYPGRFVMGLGVGYPEQAASVEREFGRPLATMRDYCQRMHEPTWPPVPDTSYPRIIAANGPKMIALAGEIADGAFPAGLPAEFTARAREALGPDKLLVVGLSLDPSPTVVWDSAHEHLLAGADHVTILPPLGGDFGIGIDQLEKIAPALTELAQPRPGLV